ncbi:TusE/DsrC/DsvC family sulfur relay protein [candidate division KSB1 bacterium]|nr:TusE/DsrC/DsvC family sulfur relay protein [candidate division KSB1 bacterium]
MPVKNFAGKQVKVDEEGFLLNPDDWTEEIASELASAEGIDELTDKHWKLLVFMREDYKENGKIPTIRRIKNNAGIPVKEIYSLFPDGPAKKAAKIAGLGKPEGCV